MRVICFILLLLTSLGSVAADYDQTITAALTARNQGDFETAEALLREAHTMARDKREAAYLLGLVLAFQEKHRDAMAVLDRALEDYPGDTNLVLARARVLSYQGQFSEAVEIAEALLADQPNNTDAANLAGRVSIYRQRWNDAKRHYDAVLAIDPNNLEAIVGKHDIARATGDEEQMDAWLLRAQTLSPNHPDVISRAERSSDAGGPVHQLTAGWGMSDISRRGFSNWYERFMEYRHGAAGERQQAIRVEHAHRFGDHDSFVELELVFPDLPLTVSYGIGMDEDFLPEWRAAVGSAASLYSGSEHIGAMTGLVNYRHSRYRSGTVKQLSFDFDYYYLSVNGWLSPGIVLTRDETGSSTTGWRIYSHHQVHPDWRLGLGFTDAPETENNVTRDTENVHGYVQYRFANRWSARLDLSHHRLENAYSRRAAMLSVSYRF